MFLSAYLAVVCSQMPVDARAGENPLTQLVVRQGAAGTSFEWADPEERLRGTLGTGRIVAGQPLTISATLEPIDGPPFEGPITIAVRPLDSREDVQSQTVKRSEGERVWAVTVVPAEATDYRVEISWRSTHHKVVRGVFPVRPAGLPPWLRWAAAGTAIALALAVGVWILLNPSRKEASP